MLLVTTPNRVSENVYSTELKQVAKVANLDNGLREKRKWLPNSTKPRVGAIDNGVKKIPAQSQSLDKTKVEN